MASSNTDLFKKGSRRLVTQIGGGGVADNSTTTVPLSSTTNLATDTAVVVTIDRVDSNGTATPALEETVIGVVSGSNLINCVRGAEGTAQAHNAGAVVEVLFTAKSWNDLITGLLVEHNQLGGHTNISASNISASGTITNQITNADLVLTGNGTGKVKIGAKYGTITSDSISASAVTANLATSNIHTISLDHTFTTAISISNAAIGQVFTLRLLQDSTGTCLVSWFTTIKWAGGSAPTLTTTANKADMVGFVCTASGQYDGFIVGQNL